MEPSGVVYTLHVLERGCSYILCHAPFRPYREDQTAMIHNEYEYNRPVPENPEYHSTSAGCSYWFLRLDGKNLNSKNSYSVWKGIDPELRKMEGPSVHALADELQFFVGQEIARAGGNARQPIEKLEGRKIDGLKAVKKRLFFRTGEIVTVVHFLMYGSYRVNEERKEKEERLYLDCTEDRLNF